MKKSKAKFWIILWLIVYIVCASVMGAERLVYIIQNGAEMETPPYTVWQLVVIWGVLPFVLLPMLVKAFYHAIQEKRKWLKCLSGILIFHHILAVIGISLTAIGLI